MATMFSDNDLGSRKREREDDLEDHVWGNGPLSFQEHRSKQKRIENIPLPLRSSPPPPRPAPRSHSIPWTSSPAPSPIHAEPHGLHHELEPQQDCDMDMAVDGHLEPGPMQPDSMASPTNGHHANALATRMPTPIQPTFASQVHPHMQDRTIGGAQAAGAVLIGTVDSSAVPRSMEGSDWAQTRRLPSPISEGEPDFPTSPAMVLDSHFAHQQMYEMEHEQPEPAGGAPCPTVEVMQGGMEVEGGQPTTTPSPPKKGHTRSRHTLNSWTWKPGMKRSFSIGYRADCEKCRLKVPGHFNHIIIS